ncbi:phosphotransferase [Bacillus sp. JJ1566]|uniref:phosphotransferase n=1 Tax=Bacillus sp. JJ1566 TaxID=3122961 RepID=UPI002FFDF94C
MNIDLFKLLMEHYQLSLGSYEIIRKTNRSLLIKCKTNQGIFILKRAFTSSERLEFLLQAMEYLREGGIHIPKILKTIHQNDYVSLDGNFYYLQEWVPSINPPVTSVEDLIELSKQIGTVHKISKDYQSPKAHLFFKGISWEYNMKRALFLLDGMRLVKNEMGDIDFFLHAGELVMHELEKSLSFPFLKNLPFEEQFLCHNDIHLGNLLKNDSGLFIIDWDFAKYDIPAKDMNGLVKIMGEVEGKWDKTVFESMLEAYTKENPISDQLLSLIYLYLAFPHNALNLFIKVFTKAKTPQQIKSLLKFEKEKTEYMLNQIEGHRDRSRVPPI